MAKALVLVLLVLMSCLVASTVGFAEVFRRAAQSFNSVKRQSGGKQCCLPSEFTLSSVIVNVENFNRPNQDPRLKSNEASFDFAYSAKANKIFLRPTERGRVVGSAVAEINNGKVSVKAADRRSCRYDPLGQFSDSFFTKFVDGQLCIPDVFLNYRGADSFDGQPVEVYNLYNFEFSSEMSRPSVNNGGLQMKALRLEDGSCLPVEVAFHQTTRQPDFAYNLTLTLKSPTYSMSADYKLFDSAC